MTQTPDVLEQVKALLSQLDSSQMKELGLKQAKGKIYVTERNQLRINVDKGIGRNKGATVGRYRGTQYFDEGLYAWLGGASVGVITNGTKGTVTVSMTALATPQEIALINEYMKATSYVIPKEKTAEPEQAKQPDAPAPTPTPAQPIPEVTDAPESDTTLAVRLMAKLQISKSDADNLVKQNRQEAELLLKG